MLDVNDTDEKGLSLAPREASGVETMNGYCSTMPPVWKRIHTLQIGDNRNIRRNGKLFSTRAEGHSNIVTSSARIRGY